jgi:hypothetical protein
MAQSFKNKEFQQLGEKELVQVYRYAKHADKLANLYRLTYRANKIVSRFYKLLLGEEELPVYVK